MSQKQTYHPMWPIQESILIAKGLAAEIIRRYRQIPYRPAVFGYVIGKINLKDNFFQSTLEQKIVREMKEEGKKHYIKS